MTAGTIFHATRRPLTSSILAMSLIATATNGMSSVELGRRLGIWQTRLEPEAADHGGDGGPRGLEASGWPGRDGRRLPERASAGQRGRGAAGKQPFVAAVSTSDDRRPRKIKLLPRQGLPQAGGRGACGRAPGFDQPARDRRAELLDRCGRGRAGATDPRAADSGDGSAWYRGPSIPAWHGLDRRLQLADDVSDTASACQRVTGAVSPRPAEHRSALPEGASGCSHRSTPLGARAIADRRAFRLRHDLRCAMAARLPASGSPWQRQNLAA